MATIPKTAARRRLIVGISGASGVVYGMRLLELLREAEVETHLVMTRSAEITLAHETGRKAAEVRALADCSYANEDIAAAIASGSFPISGMIVAPCSIRSLSEIATGVTAGLLSRAADVCLKERRRVVLMVRDAVVRVGYADLGIRAPADLSAEHEGAHPGQVGLIRQREQVEHQT